MRRLIAVTVLVIVIGAVLVSSDVSPSTAANTSAFEQTLSGTFAGSVVYMRVGKTAPQAGRLDPGDRVLVIGRNGDGAWLRIKSPLGNGYVPAGAVKLRGDVKRLPVVSDSLPVSTLPPQQPVSDTQQFPVLPTISPYAREIYQRGLKAGNRPDVFSKVGDCMTADLDLFLGRFGTNSYRLGKYTNLQPLINYYRKTEPRPGTRNSFLAQGLATHTGFNASSVEDPTWANPRYCARGETPLACEYRLSKPSVAVIMFGTNDITVMKPAEFDFYLRLVVFDTIDRGIIPLLSTFPGDPYREQETHRFNQIIFQVARDYDVPVMNLWAALQPLPYHGRNPRSMYLSRALYTRVSFFTDSELRWGYTLRNLLTLESMDRVWREVILKAS